MREFTYAENLLIARGLRVLQYLLIGKTSKTCFELAEYFESMARVTMADEEDET